MRFVDASVFVHAYLKPKRKLKPNEVKVKESAKEIVKRINDGEEVGITVVQITEIANLLESYLPLSEALKVEEFLLLAGNVKVFDVTKKDCLKAVKIAKEKDVGLSDAIAYVVMKKNSVGEIYSFDTDFDKLDVTRVTE
ncbi:PilT protein domain protein [Ferroglobus placidus DSM 10642]|uniref:PilT protein domain protein n=1 Tax=Ferroglobus placidus (strain DSM 10642 / AEDII12DO) TaxID=589924 RepID=D3S219_FERPA|nr:type II toxin-antitoxin system VapC family toxin [Ferroglobus placidus]ADC66510.1 PilT protein domain protein [Ferroglobus placidus DSM 10642]